MIKQWWKSLCAEIVRVGEKEIRNEKLRSQGTTPEEYTAAWEEWERIYLESPHYDPMQGKARSFWGWFKASRGGQA